MFVLTLTYYRNLFMDLQGFNIALYFALNLVLLENILKLVFLCAFLITIEFYHAPAAGDIC